MWERRGRGAAGRERWRWRCSSATWRVRSCVASAAYCSSRCARSSPPMERTAVEEEQVEMDAEGLLEEDMVKVRGKERRGRRRRRMLRG